MARTLGDNLTIRNGDEPAGPTTKVMPTVERLLNSPPPTRMNSYKRVRIILEENPDIPPTGLFISHNGNPYMIRPGEEVSVPEPLIEILNNAITSVPILDNGNRVVGSRNKMRFPYRFVSSPPPVRGA